MEGPVIDRTIVAKIRALNQRGYGIKRIARDLDIARNTVRRYLYASIRAGEQTRPTARRLNDSDRKRARILFEHSFSGNATAVYRQLVSEGVRVKVWTVRRAVADLRVKVHAARAYGTDTVHGSERYSDEMQLVRSIAVRRGGVHSDDLEAELTTHLVKLVAQRHKARNWRGLLITALTRKARSWLKKRARLRARETSLDQPLRGAGDETDLRRLDEPPSFELTPDETIVLAQMRQTLPTRLRRVFDALEKSRGNQVLAARLLGIHSNTLRTFLREMAAYWKARGYELT